MKQNNKIMLIDDNPGDGILLREALKIANLEVEFEAFQSGKLAMEELERRYESKESDGQFLPDLILLDLNMPGLSGLEVLELLKKHEFLTFIPVVVMTTSSLTTDAKDCYVHGANSVIVKPMDFDKYIDIIKLLIEYWFKTVKKVDYEY